MTFRFRLIITIALLIALTFAIGGTVLISASFSAARKEEITSALDSFESAQNTLVLLNSISETTDVHGFSAPLSQMEAQGMTDWQAVTLRRGEELLYQSRANYSTHIHSPFPSRTNEPTPRYPTDTERGLSCSGACRSGRRRSRSNRGSTFRLCMPQEIASSSSLG